MEITEKVKFKKNYLKNKKGYKAKIQNGDSLSGSEIEKLILKETGNKYELLDFLNSYFDLEQDGNFITSTSTKFNIDKLRDSYFQSIINLKNINDARYINKFFESINSKLPYGGMFFGQVQTYPIRRDYILKKYPPFVNWVVYFIDLFFTRVLPKLWLTKKIYFYLTKGRGRVLSRAEVYGRLYSCGFEFVEERSFNNVLYFIFKKIKEPSFDKNPTYGALIKLKRIGLNKELFTVYKLRTMHPFSEYLQEFIYNRNNLRDGGKIKNDFRISPEGRILRKFWIDELPMLWNVIRGDMKLVGVRPLSPHFFSLYDESLQNLRTQFKPGFIPPFYADNPRTLAEIMESERKYLEAYKKRPFTTDLDYLMKSLNNVFFGGLRSF